MSRRCRSCDGILGVDCFNEEECMWIGEQQERQREYERSNEILCLIDRVNELKDEISELKGVER